MPATLKPFPDAEKFVFKQAFVERYSSLTDWETFKKYTLSFLRKSIRVNTLKISVEELKNRLKAEWLLEQIPWCGEGFWIEHKAGRLDVGNTIEHSLGYYYVQEAASMIPPIILEPKAGDVVLDIAAAPGSKASQIAQYMANQGVLVANDVKGERLAALGINMQRMGVYNCLITQMPGQNIRGVLFDKLLLDAPCSGTGTIRKSPKTIEMWNPKMISRLSGLQKKLILSAWNLLKPGGILVYSTCSLEPEENEGVVDFLISQTGARLEEIKLDIKRSPAILEFEGASYSSEVSKCLRIWPQDNDTEGFFVAKIRKPES